MPMGFTIFGFFAYIAENGIGKLLMRMMVDYINISYI